jgi:mannose-1-phosphate guanylyltransferase
VRRRATVATMRAMILAAGLGTRLRPLTEHIPKPALPVVDVPNIERTIAHLVRFGVSEIVVNLHHCPGALRELLGDGSALGVSIAYSEERPEILGTGGGIKRALPFLGKKTFLVVNGDALFAPDLAGALDAHRKSGAVATMIVREDPHSAAFGAVEIDGDDTVRRLIGVGEGQGGLRPHMFTGVHVLEPEIGALLPDSGCIVRETYVPLIRRGGALGAFVEKSPFCDLGTPERYLGANADLVTGAIRLAGFEAPSNGVYVGPGARLGSGCFLGPGTVVERGARVAGGIILQRSLVRAGAFADRSASNTIFCEDGTLIEI